MPSDIDDAADRITSLFSLLLYMDHLQLYSSFPELKS